jgi:hypothetical protein
MVGLKKCYVVTCSSGQYDDFKVWIDGIFLSASDAEKRKREIEDLNQEVLDTPYPFEGEELDYLTDEQLEDYYRWDMDRYYAQEFNGAEVKEYELK